MLQIFAANQFLRSQIKCFFSDAFKLRISFGDVLKARLETLADLNRILALELAQFLDEPNDLIKNTGPVLLDVPHELFDLFIFRTIDHKLVALFHVEIELLGEF